MEGLLDWLKLWIPFAGVSVAFFMFGWRVLNRREDKLEARMDEGFQSLRDLINELRVEMRNGDAQLREEMRNGDAQLREETRERHDQLWEEMRERHDQFREEIREGNAQLGIEIRDRDNPLRDEMREKNDQLWEEMRQISTRMDANAQTIHADMSKLTEKIESNSNDLRIEIARLHQNHVTHLEHHEESRQRAEAEIG